jgi:hypothetical protein
MKKAAKPARQARIKEITATRMAESKIRVRNDFALISLNFK